MEKTPTQQTQTIKLLPRFSFQVVILSQCWGLPARLVRHRGKSGVSPAPWWPWTHRASSALGTCYERVFGWNIQFPSAPWTEKWSYLKISSCHQLIDMCNHLFCYHQKSKRISGAARWRRYQLTLSPQQLQQNLPKKKVWNLSAERINMRKQFLLLQKMQN